MNTEVERIRAINAKKKHGHIDSAVSHVAFLLDLVAELERENEAAEKVIEAARCIRHWHDTGAENEGMIVSSKHVHELWSALELYDELGKPTEGAKL